MRGKWSLMVVVGLYASACLSTLRQTLPLEFWFQHSISLGSDWFLQTSFQGCVFFSQQPTLPTLSVVQQPEKTANISREMTPEKRAQDSTLITHHYPELSNASDWLCRMENLLQQIRSTTQIWVVTHHQYGISAFVGKPAVVQQNFSCFKSKQSQSEVLLP